MISLIYRNSQRIILEPSRRQEESGCLSNGVKCSSHIHSFTYKLIQTLLHSKGRQKHTNNLDKTRTKKQKIYPTKNYLSRIRKNGLNRPPMSRIRLRMSKYFKNLGIWQRVSKEVRKVIWRKNLVKPYFKNLFHIIPPPRSLIMILMMNQPKVLNLVKLMKDLRAQGEVYMIVTWMKKVKKGLRSKWMKTQTVVKLQV